MANTSIYAAFERMWSHIINKLSDKVSHSDDPVFALEDSEDIYADIINADTFGGYTIEGLKELIFDNIYPIGSIYTSINETNPSNLFGGTWEQLKDRFLLGAGDIYTNGAVGGEATVTLTIEEMPAHTHTTGRTKSGGSGTNIYVPATSGAESPVETTSTGGGAAHNNMPPYLVVYMWKRIA